MKDIEKVQSTKLNAFGDGENKEEDEEEKKEEVPSDQINSKEYNYLMNMP